MGRMMNSVRRSIVNSAPHKESVASTPVATFNTDIVAPLASTVVDIVPVQSGSGDPSFDNIRPITGWTGANVYRQGKNLMPTTLWDGFSYYGTVNVGTIVTPTVSSIQLTETQPGVFSVTLTSQKHLTFMIPVEPNNYYRMKYTVSSTGDVWLARGFMAANGEILSKATSTALDVNTTLHPTNAKTAYYYIVFFNGTTPNATITWTEPQVEHGDAAATAYEPYSKTTYPISWQTEAGTVYKGVLNVLTGQLDITWYGFVVTSITGTTASTSHWSLLSHGKQSAPYDQYYYGVIQIQVTGGLIPYEDNTPNNGSSNGLCSYGRWRVDGDDSINEWRANARYSSAKHYIRIVITRQPQDVTVAFANDLLSSLSIPLTVIYRLKTPISVQLTTQEVLAFTGQNNVWADTGNVALDYWKHG